MKKILITAFDAFGRHAENPSEKLLSSLKAQNIIKLVLPTIYGTAEDILLSTMDEEKPAAILLLDYSKAAEPIKLELMARNKDSKIAKDNLGQTGTQPIVKGGAEKLGSTLPINTITRHWEDEGIAYTLSENAGGFLCNHVLYLALLWLRKHGRGTVPCGFMHIGRGAKNVTESRRAVISMLTLLR